MDINSLLSEKKALRKRITELKKALTESELEFGSKKLADMFLEHEAFEKCRTVYAYLAYNQEVRTFPLIKRCIEQGRKVAVPKVVGDEMHFFYIKDEADVEPGFHGIPEPKDGLEKACDKDALMLMPGLAFDAEGHRIGYGGGFYDRFLEAEPHTTIALCFDFQMVDHIPCEAHDLRFTEN